MKLFQSGLKSLFLMWMGKTRQLQNDERCASIDSVMWCVGVMLTRQCTVPSKASFIVSALNSNIGDHTVPIYVYHAFAAVLNVNN